ncbi:MAG: alpha/beta hydrolase [Pseudonocardiales bacterium]|nr:alpha/beta hydrolase [Pseudonocardiales bacterium]
MKPTIILVHGAFADSSSWNGVALRLLAEDHHVIAFAVPLRGLATDAALLGDLVRSVEGPVVMAGHSYGGAVITNVDITTEDMVALVYIAGFALEPGESCADASALAAGSTLGETLVSVPLAAGGADAYIAQERYHAQFAADLPTGQASVMAVTQRPVTVAALSEPSGGRSLWQSVPSWFLFGELDRNIPVGAHRIMAERADARQSVEIAGASHVVGISHADETARIILAAAQALTTA